VSNRLLHVCQSVCCSDRYVVVLIGNYIIFNLYLPCVGTIDRLSICEDIMYEIWELREQFSTRKCILAGDFNTDLTDIACQGGDETGRFLRRFLHTRCLSSCYDKHPGHKFITFCTTDLKHESLLDYFFVSHDVVCNDIFVADLDNNYSDHMPIVGNFEFCNFIAGDTVPEAAVFDNVTRLRWDHADLLLYYSDTRIYFEPLYDYVKQVDSVAHTLTHDDLAALSDEVLNNIVRILALCANRNVPVVKQNFYKHWWNEGLSRLKDESIRTNALWRAAGKPRTGPTFIARQSARAAYRSSLRKQQSANKEVYTNALHEALMRKDPNRFWQSWRAKFGKERPITAVDNSNDVNEVLCKFKDHFESISKAICDPYSNARTNEYNERHAGYTGDVSCMVT